MSRNIFRGVLRLKQRILRGFIQISFRFFYQKHSWNECVDINNMFCKQGYKVNLSGFDHGCDTL